MSQEATQRITPQMLEELNKRIQALNLEMAKTDAQRDMLLEKKRALEAQLKEEYGTSDLDELRNIYLQAEAKNREAYDAALRQVAEAQQKLSTVQSAMKRIQEGG